MRKSIRQAVAAGTRDIARCRKPPVYWLPKRPSRDEAGELTMKDSRSRAQLTAIVEQRRRELSERPDISVRMRKLSESNGRNPIPVQPKRRPTLVKILLAVGAIVVLAVC